MTEAPAMTMNVTPIDLDRLPAQINVDASYPCWPYYDVDQINAVVATLKSGRVNAWTGDDVSRFETRMGEKLCPGRRCIALANGTVSLELALDALEIGAGDEVIVTPRSFIASVACVVRRGAVPVFADVDRDSQNLTRESVERMLSPRTRGMLLVHLAGWPCEMDGLVDLAEANGLWIIEDCAQAHGARYNDMAVGTFGTFASWSFCQDKIVSTGGEGGALATGSESLWRHVRGLKDHGKSRDVWERRGGPVRPGYRWVHDSFGTNARMAGVQAAIGVKQLDRLACWTAVRGANARRLWEHCRAIPGIRCPEVPPHIVHACYLGYAFVVPEALRDGWGRRRILAELMERGVPVTAGSCPELYLEPAFSGKGYVPTERLPIARQLGETSLAFQVHPRLRFEHVDRMAEALAAVMSLAVR